MANNYEAFLASKSAEISQSCTEATFIDFVNNNLTEDYLKCILTALAPGLYSAVTSHNSNCTVTIHDMLSEAVKDSPDLTEWEWETISNNQSSEHNTPTEASEVKVTQPSVDDLTTPVGKNPKWNIPEDYPFKDEPPLYITKPGVALKALCSEDIRKWCSVHNVKVKEFNHPCIIDDSFTNCQGLFCYCESFNQPVAIPKSAIHCLQMFAGCESFNQPIIIPNSVTNCYRMFYCCKSFNQPISIPDSVTKCYGMLGGCKSFNQHVEIPNSVIECQYMFDDCKSFNQPITIPDSVIECGHMFKGCDSFNQPVTIPDSVTNCVSMFQGCHYFNQPITIPNSVTDCKFMFWGCESLNQPVTIPDAVTKCAHMFDSCYALDRSKILGYKPEMR